MRWGGPTAERALAEAQEVWTETQIDPASDIALQALVARYGIDRERTLSSQLSPERARQLRDAASAFGLAPEQVETMKPWLAGLTFSLLPMLKAGYDQDAGVDRTIDRLAEAAGKRMRWFETGEEQIRFLSGFPQPMQIEMLEDTLDELAEGTSALVAMDAAWEVGDDRVLAREMVNDMRRSYPQLYDVLIKRRNAAWTETLVAELAGEGVDLVVVGAAHLAGPDSLQHMLRERGFKVERASAPRP